jgi:hypothetical protein
MTPLIVLALALALAGTASARRVAFVAAWRTPAGPIESMAWAVAAAGRHVPSATCLTQALALQAMLARRGHPARVEIGVLKDPAFRAHAWVVAGDRVLLGGSDRHLYRPIAILE